MYFNKLKMMVKSVVYLCFTGHPFFNLFDLTYVVEHAEKDGEVIQCGFTY